VRAARRSRRTNHVALTNRQIERYSRQIIVDKFGGVAQERLLTSRVLLIANYADAEAVLAYLVGAGVGNIDLRSDLDIAARGTIIARMRDLNSDSTVVIGDAAAADIMKIDLAIAIVDDDATLVRARALRDRASNSADRPRFGTVLARLDVPARLAVIPSRPPCLQCANAGELLAPVGPPAYNAGFIAMLAVLEAIKLLTHYPSAQKPTLIEFSGYQASMRTLDSVAGFACACCGVRTAKVPE
jgi:molybdopterin/thiamine biosynthesis adenylyltransferase